jgi:hypothetical protein
VKFPEQKPSQAQLDRWKEEDILADYFERELEVTTGDAQGMAQSYLSRRDQAYETAGYSF